MEYPLSWPEGGLKRVVMNHFRNCPNFEIRWNQWGNDFKERFYEFVVAVHNADFDWYYTNSPDLRIGYKDPGPRNGRNIALVKYRNNDAILSWNQAVPGNSNNGTNVINSDLIACFSENPNHIKNIFVSANSDIRLRVGHAYWPDQYLGRIDGDDEGEGEGQYFELLTKMNLNTILNGPPGTGKTHSVTALALSILSGPAQQAQYNAGAILNGKPPLGQVVEWRRWVEEFNRYVSQGRIEVTTFHQNYSYEDFVEGLKASVVKTEGGSAVAYAYERGILKRIAYRALHAWLTGAASEAAEMLDAELELVRDWLKNGTLPETETARRAVGGFAPPYVLIIDEINRGNVARIFGELITLVEGSKRARLEGEIELGNQPLSATLPYTKESFILPPNLYIIGTMNTADRSLVGLDAALRRRFEFVELAPQPELLKTIGDVGDQVDLKLLLAKLNARIVDAEKSTDHEIGHAYFLGVNTMEDLATVMARQVIPQLREYFFDQSDKIRTILASSPGVCPFIDARGKTVMAALLDSANYRQLSGAV